jgi:hypothetical protein
MAVQTRSETIPYEQAIVHIVRRLPRERAAQVLDFARFIAAETPTSSAPETPEPEERLWSQAAVRSLARYWDTPEEDEAWAHLQKATSS